MPHVERLLKTLTKESVDVALRSGVVFPAGYGTTEKAIHSAAYEHVKDVVIHTAKNRNSMLQDIEKGRKTEVEQINGYVVQEGTRLGLDVTTNKAVFEMVRAIERLQGDSGARDQATVTTY